VKRYYVFGGIMEYMFHLHCEAVSEEDALRQWDEAFPNETRHMCMPRVYAGDPEKDLYRYESGGYEYEYEYAY
jgi:hypothetical protein